MTMTPYDRVVLLRKIERDKRSKHLLETNAITFGNEPIPPIDLYKPIEGDYYLRQDNAYCFCCDSKNHSQHVCPLKECPLCFQFGHSQKLCPLTIVPVKHHRLPVPKSRFFRNFLKPSSAKLAVKEFV